MKKWDVAYVNGCENSSVIITSIEKDVVEGVYGYWHFKEEEIQGIACFSSRKEYCLSAIHWLPKITIQKRFLLPKIHLTIRDKEIKKLLLNEKNHWPHIEIKKNPRTEYVEEDYYRLALMDEVPPKIVGVSIFDFNEEYPRNSIITNIMFDNILYIQTGSYGEHVVIKLMNGESIDISENYNMNLIGGNTVGLDGIDVYKSWVKYKQRMV